MFIWYEENLQITPPPYTHSSHSKYATITRVYCLVYNAQIHYTEYMYNQNRIEYLIKEKQG